jgi:hypothetical protein
LQREKDAAEQRAHEQAAAPASPSSKPSRSGWRRWPWRTGPRWLPLLRRQSSRNP